MISQRTKMIMVLAQRKTGDSGLSQWAVKSKNVTNNDELNLHCDARVQGSTDSLPRVHKGSHTSITGNEFVSDFTSDVSDCGESLKESGDSEDVVTSDDTVNDPNYSSEAESGSSSQSSVPSSNSSEFEDEPTKEVGGSQIVLPSSSGVRSKKRRRNESQWKKKAAKIARNSGKDYISSSKSKKVFGAKSLKPACTEKCRLKCKSRIAEDTRQQIFTNYWALGDSQRQKDYLSSCVIPIKPKYHYRQSNRKESNSFNFIMNGLYIRVCKTFFKSTLDISDRPIRTMLEKRVEAGGMVSEDLRGRHGKHQKLDASIRDGIRSHINSIPRIDSHYIRARSNRQYIEGGKSLRDLHRDYVQNCVENQLPFGKYLIYHQVFVNEFNISFYTPKKDQCSLCTTYLNSSIADKETLQDEYKRHITEKQLSRVEKENDKTNVDQHFILACFDLQAVLPCPKGEVSTFYYTSKLNVLNFTIYEINKKEQDDQCFCYLWDETQGQRGANEIGSCLFKFIEKKSLESSNFEIVFYSDNCVGQQKNRFIITMYVYALQKFTNLKAITHKFLISGHTQNEGDSAHSVIERQVKRALKSGPIYLPSEYVGIIKSAKKNGKPYIITEMSFADFIDLKNLNAKIGKMDKGSDTDDKLSDIKIIRIEKDDPYKILYKISYSEEHFKVLAIKKPRTTVQNKGIGCTLQQLYQHKFKIPDSKKKGLLNLLEKQHIPIRHAEFYNNL